MALNRRAAVRSLAAAAALCAAALTALAGAGGEPERPAFPMAVDADGNLVVPRGLARPWVPADNPVTPARVALGLRLFHDASLSRDRTVSCATCHDPARGFAGTEATATGAFARRTTRNAPTLWNVALHGSFFWDGRAATLEEQARQPVVGREEFDMTEDALEERLRAHPEYPALFEKAFGSPGVTFHRFAQAVATFERTLLAGDAPFDRWWRGEGDASAFGAAEQRGLALFAGKARCSLCHTFRQSHALFADDRFHNTGVGWGREPPDPGRARVTERDEDRGAFRTPTLRNVALTAPYFHDGSAATLEDVIAHYDRGGAPDPRLSADLRPLGLTAAEKADLVAFLRALTSDALRPPEPAPRSENGTEGGDGATEKGS